MKAILRFLLVFAIWYLIVGFISGQFNALRWETISKVIFVCIGFWLSIIGSIILGDILNDRI